MALPPNSRSLRLDSPLEIKQHWLYNEWASPSATGAPFIKRCFHHRSALNLNNPPSDCVAAVFERVRGRFCLWGDEKESATWTKVTVDALDPEWFWQNVAVLYPSEDRFDVRELQGLVLWRGPNCLELLEGNHRVSAWLKLDAEGNLTDLTPPPALPATLYIGEKTHLTAESNAP